jgi:hypothetical protein
MTARIVHGTPITPKRLLDQLRGESFCVSFARPDQLELVLGRQDPNGILMLDNGAFTHWKAGKGRIDRDAFFSWANEVQDACDVAVAVIPDVIGGSEEENWVEAAWAVRGGLSDHTDRLMFVWHMNDSLETLKKAARLFNFVAIGSCEEFDVQKHRAEYLARLKEASAVLDYVERFHGRRPWVHLMRGLAVYPKAIRFESADSANIARNHCKTKANAGHVRAMADRIAAPILAAAARPERGATFPTTNFAPAADDRALSRARVAPAAPAAAPAAPTFALAA